MDSKRRKLSPAESAENTVVEAVAGPSKQTPTQTAPIFKLDTDCCDHIFDYLKVDELHSVSQTCKALQQVAGEYFYRNYFYFSPTTQSGFQRFVRSIYVDMKSVEDDILSYKWDSVEKVYIEKLYELDEIQFANMKQLLPKIHTMEVTFQWVNKEFISEILNQCTNLKRLIMIELSLTDDILLLENQSINSLSFGLSYDLQLNSDAFIQFLERNTNIKTFKTYMEDIRNARDRLLNSNVRFESLQVELCGHEFYIDEWAEDLDTIDQLYAKGFYKRLCLNTYDISQPLVEHFPKVQGLEGLIINELPERLNWYPLPGVKELCIESVRSGELPKWEELTEAFMNIERFYICGFEVSNVVAFISRLKKLKQIKLLTVKGSSNVLNLQRWNLERKKLTGARKVIIYVEDDVFLATKWQTPNGDIDLEFIEMRRCGACKWDPEFI